MVLFIVLGVVVVIAVAVLGFLFYSLSKEGQKKEDAVPVTNFNDLKNELSAGSLEPPKPDIPGGGDEIIPAFVPKMALSSAEEEQSPAENDTYKKRAQELEDELRAIKQKAEEQADVAREMIVTLTKENQSLKSKQAESEDPQQKLTELQTEAATLKTENITLQTQLEATNAKVLILDAKIDELSREKEVLLSAPKPEVQPEVAAVPDESVLKQKCEDLEKTNQELQYELVKARAQSSGLERVTFNYKNQVEGFLKKINETQVINEQLSQVKNRLEGMVEEVKLQNEELVKKDHLAQFELEKNHSRLVNLERECQELKGKLPAEPSEPKEQGQQQDQQ